jgi:hypothetical protein
VPPVRLVASAVALALAVMGCSNGDDTPDDDTESSAAEFDQPTVDLTVASAELISPHKAKGPLDDATADAVAGVVEELLLTTSARPLGLGAIADDDHEDEADEKPAARTDDITELFTLDAGERATTTDRNVFFDEDVPPFGELVTDEATLHLRALAGTMDPATALVVARYRWNVTSAERPEDRVVREGELQLIPDGADWKIGAYTIVVTRTVEDRTTTTTATTR